MFFIKSTSLAAALFAAVLLSGADALLDLARAGDTASQLKVAGEFFYGRNRRLNRTLAFYWFRKAANGGSPEAQYNLAVCLQHGSGCEKNLPAAFIFFEKALNNGIAQALIPYTKLLFNGVNEGEFEGRTLKKIPADREKAIGLLRKHAGNGDRRITLLLAKFLYADVEKHAAELRHLLAGYCASNADADPEAMVIYAACLRSGIGGFPPDPAAGAGILQRAAEKKHPEAMAQLAEMYYNGFGVKVDRRKALALYEKAIAAGSARAMTDYGELKLAGVDTAHDPVGAFKLFHRAAMTDYPAARRKLGECYANGIGTAANHQRAMNCYHDAAKNGDRIAAYRLGESYRDGIITAKNDYAAFYFFQQAALAGYPAAMRETGKALLEGRGTDKDHRRAVELLRRAADAGDREAALLLR